MIKVVLQESPLKPQGIRIVLKGVGRWTGMLASTYTHCKAGINLKLGHIPPHYSRWKTLVLELLDFDRPQLAVLAGLHVLQGAGLLEHPVDTFVAYH